MIRWTKPWLAAVILAGFIGSTGAAAQEERGKAADPPETLEQLSSRIAAIVEQENLVGVTAALVNADGVFWAGGYGMVDKETGAPATADSLFRVGSISKSVTGLIAMRLVEEGRLDLDARLRDVAPEVEFTNRWESDAPVRLVHLLEHTTGWDDIHLSEYAHFPEGVTIADGLAVNPKSRTSRWRPGRYPSYANSGPAVMGHVLEKMTGESFEALARRYVFRPLGLTKATFRQTPDDIARVAKSYGADGTEVAYTRIWAAPSGSLAISARELGRIVQMYIRRGEVGGARVVSPESIERIERPISSIAARSGLDHGYGLGNAANYIRDTEYHGHGGGIDGFVAFYAYRKDAPVGLVVISNSGSNGARKIVELLAGHLETRHPGPPAAEPVTASDLEAYEGFYRQFTPRNELARLITDHLDIISVRAEGGSLYFKAGLSTEEDEYVPLGDGKFAKRGRAAAHRIAYEGPTGKTEVFAGFNSTYRRVAPADVIIRISFIALVVLAIGLALLATIVWVIGRAFGKFRGAGRWRVWVWPMLSITVLVAAFGALAYAMGADPLKMLGGPSLLTRTVQWATILVPLFAALGLLAAVRASESAAWSRIHAGVTSAFMLAFAAYLSMYGWISLTVWAYTPMVVGR